MTPAQAEARIRVLVEFLNAALAYLRTDRSSDSIRSSRTKVNRSKAAAEQAVRAIGCARLVRVGATPQDPWDDVYRVIDSFGTPMLSKLVEQVDQAIGAYEHLRDETGLVELPRSGLQLADVENAITRGLRPSFGTAPPQNEREVQDKLDVIFKAIGLDATREQETAPVGPRAFEPDFAVSCVDLAIEVKYTRPNSLDESKLQEQLAADIAAYGTRWSRLLVVVYDHGVIRDPDRLRRENMKHFGVTVMVVKH